MAAPGQITGEKGEILMARLQIHTGLPDVSLDVIIPEFMKNRKAREQGLSREEYYASRNLPVLWLLHGGMGDATDWPRYSRIEMYAEEKGLIVVCPTGNNGNWVNMGETTNAELKTQLENLRKHIDRYVADKTRR